MFGAEQLFLDERPPSRRKLIYRGLVVLILAAILVGVTLNSRMEALADQRRQPLPCTIEKSDVDVYRPGGMAEKPYTSHVHFKFMANNTKRAGHESQSGSDAAEIFGHARRFPSGQQATCYFNGSDATLTLSRQATAEFWFGLGFGALLAFYSLHQFIGAIHPPNGSNWNRLDRTRYFFWLTVIFIGGVAAAFIWLFAYPVWRSTSALNWPAVECQIVDVGLIKTFTHGEVPITTYKPDVHYKYQFAGHQYHSNNYNFTDCASPWFYGKRNIIRNFTPGMKTICYVNPHDSADAVLTRSPSPTAAFAIWPLVIIVICLLTLQERRRDRKLRPAEAEQWKKNRNRRLLAPALLLAAFSFAVMFVFMGEDLVRDWRLKSATATEIAVVAAVGIAAGVLAFISGRRGLRPPLPQIYHQKEPRL